MSGPPTAPLFRSTLLRGFLVLAVALLAGCSTARQSAQLYQDSGTLPRQAAVTGVPFFSQEKYYCGPAAVAMTLAWSGLPVTQDDLVPQVYTPGREGTLQPDVVAALRRNGMLAAPINGLEEIVGEIAAGRPVLVFQNLALSWYPQWHFAVAIGYDLDNRQIVLHTGTSESRSVSLATFERTWVRGGSWAMVVLPPDQLPVNADEIAVLRAAAGLERANKFKAAATAYQSISERWPDSFPAYMGLGNTRYALSDMEGAEAAFRRAIALRPDDAAPAWNNLAYVLAAQGRREEAIAAAESAIRAGKPDDANYLQTLSEISRL